MPEEKVHETNNYLFGRQQTIATTQNETGNAGTRDLQQYLESVKNDRMIYCLYSAEADKGTMVEFFFC